jgi:hypothetical protein
LSGTHRDTVLEGESNQLQLQPARQKQTPAVLTAFRERGETAGGRQPQSQGGLREKEAGEHGFFARVERRF